MARSGDSGRHDGGDAEVVALILDDPGRGWAMAWERHGHALHSFCLRMLDDRAEAEDAVADVFVVAAQRIDQLRDPEAFRAWLYAIARRRIQRRWRDRGRTTPVDPHGTTVMNAATTDLEPDGADDAAELLAAASAGLSDRDRELLALALGANLDTTEVARITGQTTAAVSVRVTRLKDTVGRAAGALLVARHHRRNCDVLDGILAAWDGTFDPVWRKRIARHIDGCDDCERRRAAAVGVFAAPILFAPPSDALRDWVLQPISTTAPAPVPDLGPWDDDGFPTVRPRTRALPWWLAAAAVLVIAAVVAIVMTGSDGDDSTLAALDGGTATESGTDDITTTTTTSTTTSTTTTTTAPPPNGPPATAPSIGAPPTTAAAPPATPDPTIAPTPTTTTLPVAPTVSVHVTPTEVTANGTQTATVTVTITGDGAVSTLVTWDGSDAGSKLVTGTGTRTVTIGPFSAPGTVTVTATTDSASGTTTDTATLTVSPTPG